MHVLQKALLALGWEQLSTWSCEGGSRSVVRMSLSSWLRNPAALATEGITGERNLGGTLELGKVTMSGWALWWCCAFHSSCGTIECVRTQSHFTLCPKARAGHGQLPGHWS